MFHKTMSSSFAVWIRILCYHIGELFKAGKKMACKRRHSSVGSTLDYGEHLRIEEINSVKRIPKVKSFPLVGTFFAIIKAGGATQLHNYIDRRHTQYGDIFHERLGGTQDAIFVSSANLMRSVFAFEGTYPKHPLPEAWTLYNQKNNCKRGLLFMENEEWFHNRRLVSRLLLNGNLNWMDFYIRQSTVNLIEKWRTDMSAQGKGSLVIANLEQQLYRWSIDVIISVMFGGHRGSADDMSLQIALDEFSQIVHRIFETSSVLMTFPPKLAMKLNLRIWRDFEESVNQVLEKGYTLIDKFISVSTTNPDGLYEKLKDAEMPLDMIKRIFVDLVIAAADTTAFSTIWSIYLLSQDNDLQQKLYDEYHSNTFDTPLVRGFIKETLRLYPVAPFIGRYLPKNSKLGDYLIEKDTLVLLSLITSGRDPRHFPDPLKVMPERWLRNEHTGHFQGVYQANGSLPFALGSRNCIGRKLALGQMQCIMSEMAKNFNLKCMNETPIESILRMVTVPNQTLQMLITPRNKELFI